MTEVVGAAVARANDLHAQHRRSIALVVAGTGFFAMSDLLAQRLTAGGLPVHEVAWFRYLALALTLGWLAARGQRGQRSARPLLQVGRAACIVASALLFIAGLRYLPVAAATALVFSSPLFVAALSVAVLGERVGRARWAWVGLGFGGVVLVANPDPAAFNPAVLLPIGSSAAWAAALVMTRLLGARDSAVTTQTYSCGVGLVILSALLPLGFVMPQSTQWLLLLAMAVCWTCAQWLMVVAFGRGEASGLAAFSYTQLIWANLFAVVLLHQWPALTTLAGTLVIAAAGLGSAHADARRRAA